MSRDVVHEAVLVDSRQGRARPEPGSGAVGRATACILGRVLVVVRLGRYAEQVGRVNGHEHRPALVELQRLAATYLHG